MPRRILTVAIGCATLGALYTFDGRPVGRAVQSGRQDAAARPDVVIVLTDQQRADAFGAAGATDLRTPTMDRLAREGVMFTRAFAATPQCSPSRAGLLTGLYPHRTDVMGNTGTEGGGRAGAARASVGSSGVPPAGMSVALARSLPTLGTIFGAAGYDTAYFGKWHLGGTPGD